MNCPRCVPKSGVATSPYRGEHRRGKAIVLAPETHAAAGVPIARCPLCRGVFAEYEALAAIESVARRKKRGPSLAGVVGRAYEPPTEAMSCPSCSGETTRREWSMGTLVFVDVCIECRGVWLDSGELETLGG